jgi:hypothetical protein
VTRLAVMVVLGALVAVPEAVASITVATNAARPALRVDAAGNAEIAWTSGGVRRTLLVPAHGLVLPGGKLRGADVSGPVRAVSLPFLKVLRGRANGWRYALQAWRVRVGGPVELRFSRWRGASTAIRLQAERTGGGVLLTGEASALGRKAPTTSHTPEGKVQRVYVYLDALRGGSWNRIGGVAIRGDGTFRRVAAAGQTGTSYRASLPGPNVGDVYAPDGTTVARAA